MDPVQQGTAQAAENQFEALVNHSGDIIAILDPEGHLTFANQAVHRLLGFDPKELMGLHIAELLHPEDLAEAQQAFEDVPQTPARFLPVTLRLKDATGSYHSFGVIANNLLHMAPVNGVLLSAHEITTLIDRQQQLHESEARFRGLFENAPALVQCTDDQGRILFVNAMWSQSLGFDYQDVAKLTVFDIVVPDERERCRQVYSHQLQSGTTVSLATVLVGKRGQRIEVEGDLSSRRVDASTTEIFGMFRDVTQRNRMQHQLEDVNAVYRAVLRSVNYGIISTNADGTIIFFNKAAEEMLGYKSDELIGKQVPVIMHDPEELKKRATELTQELGKEIGPGFRALVAKVENTGLADEREWTYVRKDGRRFPVTLFCSAMRRSTGEVLGYVTVATDITERKRAEAELRRTHHRLRVTLEQERDASRSDFLTGLTNRRAFYEIGQFETKRAARYQRPLTLVYFDVDSFKAVNDFQGHQAGDDLLVQVGKTIKETVRQTDIASRLGGDEFAVLLPETDEQGAAGFIKRLQDALGAAMQLNGWPVTFSMGCVTSSKTHLDFDDLVKEGDTLMYQSKRGGKNRCTVALTRAASAAGS